MKRDPQQLEDEEATFEWSKTRERTAPQRVVLEYIREYIEWNGVAPSVVRMLKVRELGMIPNVPQVVLTLAMRGDLELGPKIRMGIRVSDQGW